MKFNLKTYQEQKTKQYIKDSKFILLSINANQKSQNWIVTEQELLKLKLKYYKIYNKTTKKIIKPSIYSNFVNVVGSTFFFLKPESNKVQIKTNMFQRLDSVLFTPLAIKLNKKVYTPTQSKTIKSFHYKKNMSVLYQFLITNLKSSHSLK
nr:hypothetical protein orf150 [Navicula sp.]